MIKELKYNCNTLYYNINIVDGSHSIKSTPIHSNLRFLVSVHGVCTNMSNCVWVVLVAVIRLCACVSVDVSIPGKPCKRCEWRVPGNTPRAPVSSVCACMSVFSEAWPWCVNCREGGQFWALPGGGWLSLRAVAAPGASWGYSYSPGALPPCCV